MKPTRIVLVDDDLILVQGLSALLHAAGFDVVGHVTDGRQAVDVVSRLRPDVVVMDIGMPGLNGVDATRKIVETFPDTRVLALSSRGDERTVSGMLAAGARGYVLKASAFEEMKIALQKVGAGESYLGTGTVNVVVTNLARRAHGNADGAAVTSPLTGREREVLQLLSEGHATKQIANILHVSIKTVETHRRAMMEKLNLHSVAELTKYAIREGMTTV